MLSRLKLRLGAGSAEPQPDPEPIASPGRAWDILGGSGIRHPEQFTEVATTPVVTPLPAAQAPGGAAGAEAGPLPLILAMFQVALARDPIPEEVSYYTRLFEEHGNLGGTRATLQVLTDSPEFRVRMRVPVEAAAFGSAADAEAPPMRHAVGLGTHCYAAWLLQDMHLRRYSSPFDWLFSSPRLVEHCLQDDCATLLDRAHHEAHGPHQQARHGFYHQGFGTEAAPHGYVPLFFHHNPTTDAGHGRLVRVVERFRRLLDSADDKLFLMVVGRNRSQSELAQSVAAVAAALDLRTRNATLLAVAHTGITGPAASGTVPVWQHGRHSLHSLHSSSDMVEGLSFAHYFDNLLIRRLIYQHRFDLKAKP